MPGTNSIRWWIQSAPHASSVRYILSRMWYEPGVSNDTRVKWRNDTYWRAVDFVTGANPVDSPNFVYNCLFTFLNDEQRRKLHAWCTRPN